MIFDNSVTVFSSLLKATFRLAPIYDFIYCTELVVLHGFNPLFFYMPPFAVDRLPQALPNQPVAPV